LRPWATTPEVPSQYIQDQMKRLGPIYVFDLSHYTIYPLPTYSSQNVSGFVIYKGSCLRVNTTRVTRHPSQWPNFNVNASHTYGGDYSSAPSGPEPRHVMVYPIHQSIHSLYCANLPVLAESTPPPTNSEFSFEVPVVPLALSNPDSFPFLIQFLYLKDGHALFENFLSLVPSKGIPNDLEARPTCAV